MENKRDDLGFLGVDFQYRLAHHLVEDKKYYMDMDGIIDNNMFTEPNLRNFIRSLKECFEKYDYVPSYELIGIEMRSTAKTDRDLEYIESTIEKVKNMPDEGSDLIKDKAQKFFRQQNFVKFNNKITQLLKVGDIDRFDELQKMWESALMAGNRQNIGINLRDNIGEVLSDDYRSVVPTGIAGIDEALEGGLGKGELAVLIGPSSFGKTSMTTAMANHAAGIGFKVAQIVFEDKEKQIQRKHYARITEIEARNISKPENIDRVRAIMETTDKFDNFLKIKKFNTGEVTPIQIKAYIRRLINSGFKPDMVIVDYFECLTPSISFKDQWQGEGHMMRQLESIASDLDIALWVPTQGTKESLNAEIVTMDKAGGSFKKIQIAHIVVSISRGIEDIERNIATIAILKNRSGKSGKVMEGIYFDNGKCIIDTNRGGRIYEDYHEYEEASGERTQALTDEMIRIRKEKKDAAKKKPTVDEVF